MLISDIQQFCNYFYQATYIPITYMALPATIISSYPNFPTSAYMSSKLSSKIFFKENRNYFFTESFIFFGYIPIQGTNNYLILGPIPTTQLNQSDIKHFMSEFYIDTAEYESVERFLQPHISLSVNQCFNILTFLEYAINHRSISFSDNEHSFYSHQKNRNEELTKIISQNREEQLFHNSYLFENSLHHAVSIGSHSLLEKIFSESSHIKNGKVAENTLRQAKNTFIASVTLVTRAAVKGGLGIEHAYHLSDLYIQECEKLNSIQDVTNLSSIMYYDFTDRVAKNKLAMSQRPELLKAIQYIDNHINHSITVEDVAAATGYSYSYLRKLFKQEMGISISKYITETKLTAAKELLLYSDYSLSYISHYLCFSTQSYFQNQFKKYVGLTPLQYRKQAKQTTILD